MRLQEPERTSIQITHEHDPCCFHGYGRHERIIAYNEWVATQVEGHFESVLTIGSKHTSKLLVMQRQFLRACLWLQISTR